jgi:hypothetical protein
MAKPPTGGGGLPTAFISAAGNHVSLAIKPYLPMSAGLTAASSEGPRILAMPGIGRPNGLPRRVQGPISMCGSRRIRSIFPAAGLLHTTNSSPIRTTQTGVGTAVPSRRKVVNTTYDAAARMSNGVFILVTLRT